MTVNVTVTDHVAATATASLDLAVNPAPPPPPPPPPPSQPQPGPGGVPMWWGRCLALAYLTADRSGITGLLDLMDLDANGIAVSTVDIQTPDTREDMAAMPDANGVWDFTRFWGSRPVQLSGNLVSSARGSRSMAQDALAPFLNPASRPILIYSLNPDHRVAYLRLRAYSYTATVTSPEFTPFAAQWKAADPAAYDMTAQSITVIPGGLFAFGRIYTEPQSDPGPAGPVTPTSGWQPPRHYPHMAGAEHAIALNGAYPTWPTYTITGECVGPAVINDTTGTTFAMQAGFTLGSGETLTVDTLDRQVYLGPNPTSTRYANVDFARSSWSPLGPGENDMRFDPVAAGDDATLTVTWRNAYF